MPVRSFTVEGHARADGQLDEAAVNTVTPGYFRTMGIAMRAGTGFADLRDPSAPPQVVVNEAFVRRYLADVEPLGRRITSGSRAYVVCGIVANSLQNAFGEPPTPALYFSLRDRPSSIAEIHIRTRPGAEATIAPDVRRVVRALDPALPLYNVRTLNDHVDANLLFRRIPARIFAVLAPLLLVVAATGIYAIVAYAVSQRRVEMGVRLALGATRTRVARDIVSDVLRVAGVGAGAGWIVAFMIDRVVSGGSIDLRVFVGVPIVLLLVAALASYLPARRAGRIDPMIALKQE
jgi:hypothetical protein